MDSNEVIVSENTKRIIDCVLKDLKISNPSIDFESATAKGENYLGSIIRVTVNGKNEHNQHIEKKFISKSAPTSVKFREYLLLDYLYAREIFLYQKVFPAFMNFQKNKGIKNIIFPFPKLYSCSLTEFNEILIMEDMTAQGFVMKNRREALDLQHALAVMKFYGQFHALSFALKDQNPEVFKNLQDNLSEHFFSKLGQRPEFQKSRREEFEGIIEALAPSSDKHVIQKLRNYSRIAVQNVIEVTSSEEAGNYAVITHGDCWVNNILFKYENESTPNIPTDVCFVDWQISSCASPVLDLSYFIFACTSEELRSQHYDELLRTYYSSFSSSMSMLGSDPEILFPFDIFQQHVKKFSTYGLFFSAMSLKFMLGEQDEIPDLQHELETENQSFVFECKNEDVFVKRIGGIVRDCVRLEYLDNL